MSIETQRKKQYSRLFRKFILLTMVCSLVPLVLVGWGIYLNYTRFANARMINSFQTQVAHHRNIIELFLKERRSKLQLIANTHSLDQLVKVSNLNYIFEMINQEYRSITDLGIVDEQGNHLAYIGPYDLMDKNYSQALWFKEVMTKGIYISDMFMGFRKEPHFIIAVTNPGVKKWILRATIDTEVFRSLVENVKIGETGEVYLVNQQGIFQTSPRFNGKIMTKAPFLVEPVHEGIKVRILKGGKDDRGQDLPRLVVSQAWLKEPQWMLVVKQNFSEAFNDVNHANYATLIFLHLSALTILIVSILITRYMITIIRKSDMETNELNNQLMQASKLASIGELSAGVAHEINNPLAIILTERQILLDMMVQKSCHDEELQKQVLDSMSQIDIQVHRCKHITQNLLRFARRTKPIIETVNLNSFIKEVIDLMEREAKTSGIKFFADLDENLPPVLSDPSQLQQVFLNMITNSIDAHEEKSYGSIRITTRSDESNEGVQVEIADTGSGIAPENLPKIFDPFFTIKPVGKGTGLGLSICYSIIERLGGNITVKSELGKGTKFILSFPCRPPSDLLENIPGDEGNKG
ncbi:MAG: two-component sensor histidine kinase [Deltaproteobacteria bacterium]|nr:two-component sensor histidine kinase [Deltaproteobacteria bacterium]MBW2139828.1 two-component sensor histidine kinase [Deltaproteobacteria bacterium]MBW2322178.1 two-component sensor histidine kinase [Deltaproteobacteria bacterium]